MLADAFRAARLPAVGSHLDSAACGRASRSVLDAVAAHARLESELGGYVAQAAATPLIDAARAALAALLGFAPDDVVFVENASVALTTLLGAWRLPTGARVAVPRNEWGPNISALLDAGLVIVEIGVDDAEHVDLQALTELVRHKPPALLLLDQVGSHRGVVQPLAQAISLAHAAGVPVVVDAAQGLGHVDAVTAADATFATSRKWLCGPRGVGMLAVRPGLAASFSPPAPSLAPGWSPQPAIDLQRMESAEAHVAGRVGLGVALREFLALGPRDVFAGLAGVGRRTRLAVSDVAGWSVVEDADEPCAITTVMPDRELDLVGVRAALVEIGIVTSVSQVARAPRQMTRPALRVSPHLDVIDEQLDGLAAALAGLA